MPLFAVLILVACAFLVGFLWPFRGNRVSNPKKHHSADSHYTVIDIQGVNHAFTDEQLNVAATRANRLKIR